MSVPVTRIFLLSKYKGNYKGLPSMFLDIYTLIGSLLKILYSSPQQLSEILGIDSI